MKLWEAMKLLEEDPTDVYEAKLSDVLKCRMRVKQGVLRGYYYFEVFKGKELIDKSLGIGAFNGNAALDLDWQLVKQPVTWQDAIQAWAKGNKIVWEEDAERRVFDRNRIWVISKYQNHLLDQDGDAVTVRMLSRGKWYVED